MVRFRRVFWWRRAAVVIPATVALIATAIEAIVATVDLTGLNAPSAIALDTNGTLFVADYFNDQILKLATGSTVAQEFSVSSLNAPAGLAAGDGTLYVVDRGNREVLAVTPP